jgi:hypothetical protein
MAGICTGQHGCPYQLTFCHIVADKDPTAQAVAHQQPPIRQAALVTGTPPISPESRARSWAHPRLIRLRSSTLIGIRINAAMQVTDVRVIW